MGGGYGFVNFQSVLSLARQNEEIVDPYIEDLMFQTAAKDVADFILCQARFLHNFRLGTTQRQDLITNAFDQFSPIKNQLESKERELESTLRLLSNEVVTQVTNRTIADQCSLSAGANSAAQGECFLQYEADFNDDPQVRALRAEIRVLRERISDLVSRIPLGNRPNISEALRGLALTPGEVSEARFHVVYGNAINDLIGSTSEAVSGIMSIMRVDPGDSSRRNFCIDRSLKSELQRAGQLENSFELRGNLEEFRQPLLRATNRYGARAEMAAEIALLPLSLFGGYGLARLGAQAALAAARGSRVASIVSGASRSAIVGINTVDWAVAAEAVGNYCPEKLAFFTNLPSTQTCNPEREIAQMYDESSIAQCATAAIVPLVAAGVARAAARNGANASESSDDVIEVIGTRQRQPATHLDSDQREAIQAALRRDRIMLGRRMNESQLQNISPEGRLSLFESATRSQLTRGEARRFFRILNDADGILDPSAERSLRQLMRENLEMSPREIDLAISRLKTNGTIDAPRSVLYARIRTSHAREFENLTGEQSSTLAEKILQAKRAGISDRDIRRALRSGDNSCAL